MKKSELKKLIREILSEQGVAPTTGVTAGQPSGGGTRPPLSTAPVGGQTAATGSGGSGITDAQSAQFMQLIQQHGGTIQGSGNNAKVSINLWALIKAVLRGQNIFV